MTRTTEIAGNMTSSTGGTHILIIPYPAQGHMIPLLDLTHYLLTHSNLTITIAVTAGNHHHLQPLLSSHPSSAISALILPFPVHSSLTSGAENLRDLPPGSLIPLTSTLRRLRKPILRWIAAHDSPPSVIISDMFLGWTNQLGIKRIVFSPSGALALSVMHSLWAHLPKQTDENAVVSFDDIPGQPGFAWYQLSTLYKSYSSGHADSQFLREEFLQNIASSGFVVNTFDELEQVYLKSMMDDLGHDRIWAVGPLGCPKLRNGSGPDDDPVLSWLDKCSECEVVYVCFGSEAVLTNKQIEALALGLERSNVRFVWKIKEPKDGHVDGERFGKLPTGFEDRVAGRGLIIRGWAPQVLILRHKAVGAFVTHCGWNSVLEGLSAGVMLLAWPLGADQFPNATLIVEHLKVGVVVGQGTKSLPDPDELARVLDESTKGACNKHWIRAQKLKKMATEATSEGGSSLRGLDSLVKHLSNLPKPDADVIRGCKRLLEEEEQVGDNKHSD